MKRLLMAVLFLTGTLFLTPALRATDYNSIDPEPCKEPFSFRDPLMNELIEQFKEKRIEVRESKGLQFLELKLDKKSKRKLIRALSPWLWTTESMSIKEGKVAWIKKDGKHHFIEGGDDVEFLPLSRSTEVIQVFNRNELNVGSIKTKSREIFSLLPHEIGFGHKDGTPYVLLPGFHHLGPSELPCERIDLRNLLTPDSRTFRVDKIRRDFKVLSISRDTDMTQCVSKVGALVQHRDGSIELLKAGIYLYDAQSCPMEVDNDVEEYYEVTTNSLGVFPISLGLNYRFSLKVPSSGEYSNRFGKNANYGEYLLELADRTSHLGLKYIANLIVRKVTILVQQSSALHSGKPFDLNAEIARHEIEVKKLIEDEAAQLLKSRGLELAYIDSEMDRKELLAQARSDYREQQERRKELRDARHQNKVFDYKLERMRKKDSLKTEKRLDPKPRVVFVVASDQ